MLACHLNIIIFYDQVYIQPTTQRRRSQKIEIDPQLPRPFQVYHYVLFQTVLFRSLEMTGFHLDLIERRYAELGRNGIIFCTKNVIEKQQQFFVLIQVLEVSHGRSTVSRGRSNHRIGRWHLPCPIQQFCVELKHFLIQVGKMSRIGDYLQVLFSALL